MKSQLRFNLWYSLCFRFPIAGASSGIGKGIAVNLASQGCRLALAGRNYANLEETKAQCLEQGLTADSVR